MTLEFEDITGKIIGAAIEVHKTLGPGFLEAIYESALVLELQHRGMVFHQQLPVPILYRDKRIGEHRLDLFVEDQVVVELKAIRRIEDVHFAVVRSYLRAIKRRHGLILNFASRTLLAKRVSVEVGEPRSPAFLPS